MYMYMLSILPILYSLYSVHIQQESWKSSRSLLGLIVINPRRACAARVTVVVLCVCLSVDDYSRTYRLRGGL